jgi:hypothetical protein
VRLRGRESAQGSNNVPLAFSKCKEALEPWIASMVIALATWLSIVACIDPGGSYPRCLEGPGLTVDEIFNVQQGVLQVEFFNPLIPDAAFTHPSYNPDHPPLGRYWLGLHHHLTWWLSPPVEPDGPFVVACARTGSATAFALTVLLVGGVASLWYGRLGGWMAALSLALLPRAFGHAHLAALETCMGLAYAAAVLSVTHYWRNEPPSWRTSAWTGVLLGLALLTKIQAVFIPIPLVIWALLRWRHRAIRPLLIWGSAGFVVFFAGWPWLWQDPVGHLTAYFGGAANRAELSVWLDGQQFTDRTVPRYYAALMFFWIIPRKTLVLWIVGLLPWQPRVSLKGALWKILFRQRTSPPVVSKVKESGAHIGDDGWLLFTSRDRLLIMELVFPFIVFSLPGVPVYDMERLWIFVAPLVAVIAGRGAQTMKLRLGAMRICGVSLSSPLMLSLMLWHATSIPAIHPCYLSHYGGYGLAAAARDGGELNYWGDAVTRSLLEQTVSTTEPGSTIAISPVMHQFQVEELLRQSPILRRHRVQLVAYDPANHPADYVLLFRRLADLPPELRDGPMDAELLAEVQRYNVQLAALYRLPRTEPVSATTQ